MANPAVPVIDGVERPLPAAEHLLIRPDRTHLLDGATAAVAEMLVHDPDIDLAYFDSVDESGERPVACHRPGFSPDRLRAQQYLGDVLLVRGRILARYLADGGRLDRRPSADQVAGLAERCEAVAHLPCLLYRTDGPGDAPAAAQPVLDLRSRPLVSVVMPTRGADRDLDGRNVTLCLNAVAGLVDGTDYRPLEIVVVLTPGHPGDLIDRLIALVDAAPAPDRPTLRWCHDERAFNFSNACNRGALEATGDVLVFLNDDTEPRHPGWLDRLVGWSTRADIGAVGARLLYGDGSIQHAGIWSRGGHPAHRYEGFRADHPGHLGSLTVPQNCLAVTGACLAVERAKFFEVGGFCPDFPSSYNDVDLCLKLDGHGYRTVVDPGAVLTHYESSTRNPVIEDWELELLHRRWRRRLIADPYDNPNHLAPGVEEFPPPEPWTTLERQRRGAVPHPARVWRRGHDDLQPIDERARSSTGPVTEERHVV